MVVEDLSLWGRLCSEQGKYIAAKLKHSSRHPTISINRRILYTHPVRYYAMTCFLSGERIDQASRGEKTPYHVRYEWLKQFFPLCSAHMRRYYFVGTPPLVMSLEFNGTLDMVLITEKFRWQEGSSEIYSRLNGR